jgi:hypothetical protein
MPLLRVRPQLETIAMLEIAVFTNIHGQREYSLVLGYSTHGGNAVELLSDPFIEFPRASKGAMQSRICWVVPVPHDHIGHGTRIYPYTGQAIAWQTPEIPDLLAAGPQAIEERREELYRKYLASSYSD